MHTQIHPDFAGRTDAQQAADIIKACVHCGFCNATCPTYQELGDERDGPRGRIYLIKQFLEHGTATENTVKHLDRCLTCRACETTCPSGVQYGQLVDIGRHALEQQVKRAWHQRAIRSLLLQVLPFKRRFAALLALGQLFKPLLPKTLAREIPARQTPLPTPNTKHSRTMLVLGGCAQAVATPNTNQSASRVFDRLGISLINPESSGCCGAASYHLSAHEQARDLARSNIDAWWPAIEQGAEQLIISASGCGSMLKDYAELLKGDAEYSEKAATVSRMAKDMSEVLMAQDLASLNIGKSTKRIAAHCPCSLQHGQQSPNAIDDLLGLFGVAVTRTKDKHLCCGSAGTYSVLQPAMSRTLLKNKVAALSLDTPDEIVTANVGCQMHLAAESKVPVRHWIELVDELTNQHQ